MNHPLSKPPGSFCRLCAALALLGPVSLSIADTVMVRTSTGGSLAYNKVKIQNELGKGPQNGELLFTSENGVVGHRPLDLIVQIKSDDEPALSAAEQAFASNDMKAAAEGYRKLTSSSREWVKKRAEMRLAEAAGKSGDLASTVEVFIQASAKDPAAARKLKPDLAAAPASEIDAAIAQVQRASSSATDAQKQVLLPFLAELYNAKKDTASAAKVLAELNKMAPSAANAADVEKARADTALASAQDAVAQRNYSAALSTLRANAAAFTQPKQQADALYLIAEAKAGSAKNETELKDAALAYMRVAANFRSLPDAAHVADSLLKTGEIEEKLNQPKTALSLYKQIAVEFKNSDAAKIAQQNVQRLETPKQ